MHNLIGKLLAVAAVVAALSFSQDAGAAPKSRTPSGDGARKPADADKTDGADAPSGTVNLNAASEDELQLLPGVGPSKAAAIVAWRKKHGGFKKIDDLTRVKGFGRKTLQKLRPYLSISGATTFRGRKTPQQDGGFVGRPPAMETP